jgi:hypothetical protein
MSPVDYAKYPANWFTEIRPRILARAGHRCEICGIANGSYRYYPTDDADCWSEVGPAEATVLREQGRSVRRIVLTISHTEHDVANNADSALRALCQKCHNRHDREYRQANAAETRRQKRIEHGQRGLPLMEVQHGG